VLSFTRREIIFDFDEKNTKKILSFITDKYSGESPSKKKFFGFLGHFFFSNIFFFDFAKNDRRRQKLRRLSVFDIFRQKNPH